MEYLKKKMAEVASTLLSIDRPNLPSRKDCHCRFEKEEPEKGKVTEMNGNGVLRLVTKDGVRMYLLFHITVNNTAGHTIPNCYGSLSRCALLRYLQSINPLRIVFQRSAV
jgi:hypothetical protein